MATDSPARRSVAEGVGTALLLAAVVGSGIMGDRLSGGHAGLALLANTLATGAALTALILTFRPISGAHFNPLVTGVEVLRREVSLREGCAYIMAQLAGAVAGVGIAHVMFSETLFAWSHRVRSGFPQAFSEGIAAFGLLTVILSCSRHERRAMPFAVGAYITAAYWFTASTSFANPAVTIARALTDTFTGIQPSDVPAFVAAQIAGAGAAIAMSRWLDG